MNTDITTQPVNNSAAHSGAKGPSRRTRRERKALAKDVTIQSATQSTLSTYTSRLKDGIDFAVPWAVSVLTHAICNDAVLARICYGVGFLLTGTALLKAQQGQVRPRWQTMVAVSYVAIGCLAIGWGLSDFFQRRPISATKIAPVASRSMTTVDDIKAEIMPGDVEVVEKVYDKLNSCPEANKLWNRVNSQGEVAIVLGSKSLVPSYGFWVSSHRIIAIDRSLSEDEKLNWILFEACNANYDAQNRRVQEAAAAGDLSKVQFLKEFVGVEHQTTELHHQIASACVRRMDWNPAIDHQASKFERANSPHKSWETSWSHYLAEPSLEGHRQQYYKQWDYHFKNKFCAKHPKHRDC